MPFALASCLLQALEDARGALASEQTKVLKLEAHISELLVGAQRAEVVGGGCSSTQGGLTATATATDVCGSGGVRARARWPGGGTRGETGGGGGQYCYCPWWPHALLQQPPASKFQRVWAGPLAFARYERRLPGH
jgi:hypothetical protein